MYIADWKTPAYDPAEAKRLLAAAGYQGDPIPDPVAAMVRAIGPQGELQRGDEWKHDGFNALSAELPSSTDRTRRREVFRQMLQIAEWDDPAYIVLSKAANFIGKRRDIGWRGSKGWPMLFGPGHLHVSA